MKLKLLSICILLTSVSASAQTLLGGAEISHKLKCGIGLSADVEYRSSQWVQHTDQWNVSAAASYKPKKWLKIGVDYKFLQAQTLSDGITVAYWDNKQRVGVSAAGELKLFKKLTLSLREKYQYTYRPSLLVPRFEDGVAAGNKTVSAKSKHILRSRLMAEFKPSKKCRFTPFASYEIYSLLKDVNHTKQRNNPGRFNDKWRLTVGCDYKINKRNGIELFYRYAKCPDIDDIDEPNTIGLIYSFKI